METTDYVAEIRRNIKENPEQIRVLLRRLFREVGGFQRRLADLLGVHETQLSRWVHELDLHDEFKALSKLAKAEGWLGEDRRGTGKRGPDKAPRARRGKAVRP